MGIDFESREFGEIRRDELMALAEAGEILEACFVSGDFVEEFGGEPKNGMVLRVAYGRRTNPTIAQFTKQNGFPRVFITAETIMSNAKKLGISSYRIEAGNWKAAYYKANEAINKWHQKKKAALGIDTPKGKRGRPRKVQEA